MMFAKALMVVLVNGIMVLGNPQGGAYSQTPPAPNQPQAFGTFGGQGGGSSSSSSSSSSASSSGSQGGNLGVQCKNKETTPGKFSFVCEGVDKEAISLQSEHILWLTGAPGQQQVVNIEIPNYKIVELIKAGFKPSPDGGSQINVLLKKPEQVYDAQVDTAPAQGSIPTVNLNYEPGTKIQVHYPNDKPYSPLTGPILPPLAGGRPQRQIQRTFSRGQPIPQYQREQ